MKTSEIIEAFKRSTRNQKRRKTLSQKGGRLYELTTRTAKRATITLDVGTPTASWSPDVSGNHIIKLGRDVHKLISNIDQRTTLGLTGLNVSLLRHEAGHGLYTSRDMTLPRKAAGLGIPFRLLNLFEDARIEHRDRTECRDGASDSARWFGWRRWTGCLAETNEPVRLFWSHVNSERSHRTSNATRAIGDLAGSKGRLVLAYYREAVAAPTTEALLPILQRWVLDFPAATCPPDLPRNSNVFGGLTDPKNLEEGGTGVGYSGDSDCGETIQQDNDGLPADLKTGPELTPAERKSNDYWSRHKRSMLVASEVTGLTARLTGLINRAGSAPANVSCSGSRLHMAGAMVGSAQSFRSAKAATGKRELTVVMDMSGSMSGKSHDARTFLAAMMTLHRRGLIKCHIWLTGNSAATEVKANWPVSTVSRLKFFGGCESVAATLKLPAVQRDCAASETTIVYTDGDLTDGNVDANYYRQRGVDLLGAMVTHESTPRDFERKGMDEHFGRSVLRGNASELASELVAHILRKGNA